MNLATELKEQETHERLLNTDPEYQNNYIEKAALARMELGEDCYPFYWERIEEAVTQKTPKDSIDLAFSIKKSDKSQDESVWGMQILRKHVWDYWYSTAVFLVKRDLKL